MKLSSLSAIHGNESNFARQFETNARVSTLSSIYNLTSSSSSIEKIMCDSFSLLLDGIRRKNGQEELLLVDEGGGIVGALIRCIEACNLDTRHSVSKNIIFCGGGSEIAGKMIPIINF